MRQFRTALYHIFLLLLCAGLGTQAIASPPKGAVPNGKGSYQDLVTLYDSFRTWREETALLRPVVGPVAYNKKAMDGHKARLKGFQNQLADMAVVNWDRHQQVDYLAIRAEMDAQDFSLTISRPWDRDPGFYLDPLMKIAFSEVPLDPAVSDDVRKRLAAIPSYLDGAKKALNDVAGDFADFAIHNLSYTDGVNLRHPWRAVPPAGIIGWYEDLLGRAKKDQPDLVPDINKALKALRGFDKWLKNNRHKMTGEAGVGEEHLNWFLRNVHYLPYTAHDIEVLAQRELERLYGFYGLERHRNRNLPELELPATKEEYYDRMAKMDAEVREFLEEEDLITVPDYVPSDWQEMGFNALWLERAGGPNFWEQILYRDPNPDHWHAVIPGHRFDGQLSARNTHPIRKYLRDAIRGEGWGLYWEEMPLQLGFYETYDRPRARELIHIFGIFRAVRTIGDVWMQKNEKDSLEVAEYWKKWTPYLDDDVARVDAEIYRRRPPGYGLGYTVGSFQMMRILADRKQQLGDDFNLREFHDWFMNVGRLPMALLRYELTGLSDEVDTFWERTPLSDVVEAK